MNTKTHRCFRLYGAVAVAILFTIAPAPKLLGQDSSKPPGQVAIAADFPGGNIAEIRNVAGKVQVAPDLRGDNPWFYWYFEATATTPGRVRFVFPEKVAGFKNGAIGYQGPAISLDRGKSWKWMGTDNVDGSSFFHDFSRAGQRVRFAVTIPYLQSDLDNFLDKNAGNPHLRRSVLTKSRKGNAVPLLQIGTEGGKRRPVLMTARHHAVETMASFVVEGLLQEAISDSVAGEKFRENHVLFAVPFVDRDGVEEGDQGKNRKPRDYNRDYLENSMYPEIRAIKKLHEAKQFRFTLDFHCPTLVMKDHQVMYFLGAKESPRYNYENVLAFAGRIKKNLPKNAPYGPLVWLKSESKPAPINARYFGDQKGVILAATLEIPFAPPGKAADPDSYRTYGSKMLQAWVNTPFLEQKSK